VLKKAILAFFNSNKAKAWFCLIAQIAWPFWPAQFGGPSMARLAGCFATACQKVDRLRQANTNKG
jgi:hypothetical protein